MLSFSYLILLLITTVESLLRKRCGVIHNLLFTTKYGVLKRILCVPIGYSIGQIFFSYVIYRFDFEARMQNVVQYIIVALITVSFAISIQMRAICCLVLPTFLGRITRNFLIVTVIVSLIDRPVMNTIDNSIVLSKWLFCAIKTGIEQGQEASRLLVEPGRDIMIGLAVDGAHALANNSKYKSALDRYKDNVTSKENTNDENLVKKDMYEKYKDKLKGLCPDIEAKMDNCYTELIQPKLPFWYKFFTSSLDFVAQTVEELSTSSIFGSICHNEKFRRFLNYTCTIHSNYSMTNDSSLKSATKAMTQVISDHIDVKPDFNLPSIENITEYKRVFLEVQHSLKLTKEYGKMSAKIGKNIVLFIFVFVFFSLKSYHNKYLKDISHDNNYITNYFRRIDARRKKAGKLVLLPLKKIERLDVVDPFNWKLTTSEKKDFKTSTILLVVFLVIINFILLIDKFLFDLIDLIAIYLNIDVQQFGYNYMNSNVTAEDYCIAIGKTNGSMVKKLKAIFQHLNFDVAISRETTFADCRPTPSKTNPSDWINFNTDFFWICVLNYMEMYSLRTRRIICGYFYRIRSKKRTLFLYNKLLKRRKGFLRYSTQRVRQLVDQKLFQYPNDQIANTFVYGLIDEKKCGLLVKIIQKVIKIFIKNKCIICDEKLDPNQKHFKCCETKCNLNYCYQCWNECHQRCLVCKPVFLTNI